MNNKIKERAAFLMSKGVNVIPLIKTNKDVGGSPVFPTGYQAYHTSTASIDLFKPNHAALAIITGITSGITILDLDSKEAIDLIENVTGMKVTDLSPYVIKSKKGFHIWFKYVPGLRVKHKKKLGIDILSDGSLSFGDSINNQDIKYYTTVNGDLTSVKDLPDFPKIIIDKIIDVDYYDAINSDDADDLSKGLEEEVKKAEKLKLQYSKPLYPLVKRFIDAERISNRLKEDLEAVFCTTRYVDTTLSVFAEDGDQSNQIVYVLGILSEAISVDKETATQFIKKWCKVVCKLDLKATSKKNPNATELDLLNQRVKANWKHFKYDANWEKVKEDLDKQHQEDLDSTDLIDRFNIPVWKDFVTKKFGYYDEIQKAIVIDGVMFNSFVIEIKKYISRLVEYNGQEPLEIDTMKAFTKNFKPEAVPTLTPVFDYVTDKLILQSDNDNGGIEEQINMFEKPKYMRQLQAEHYKIFTLGKQPKINKIPRYIDLLLCNLFPDKELRERFLNDLAYHLRTCEAAKQAYFIIDERGAAGKGLLFTLLKTIYGRTNSKLTEGSIVKGRFNGELASKLFIAIEEIEETNNLAGEKGTFYNFIKKFVGEGTVNTEGKGSADTDSEKHSLIIGFSNSPVPFKLTDLKDRRCNFSLTTGLKVTEIDEFETYYKNQNNPANASKMKVILNKWYEELEDFVLYLASLDARPHDNPLDNDIRLDIIESSVSIQHSIKEAIICKDPSLSLDSEFAEILKYVYTKGLKQLSISEIKERHSDYGRLSRHLASSRISQKKVNNERCWILNPSGLKYKEEQIEDLFKDVEDDIFN